MRILTILFVVLLCYSCKEEVTVKPAAMLRLDYPKQFYGVANLEGCPYEFKKNENATLQVKNNCWVNLNYPAMNATVYLTYQKVRDNIDSLLYDAQKLTYEHNIKAQAIFEQPRLDSVNNVYGMFYAIDGNAATQSQFYVTDSINHFVTGSLYFNAKPNYDSIYPAVMYLRNDIRRIMESIEWKK